MSKPLTEDSGWEVARIWQNRALAAEATADRYKVALGACLRGDLTLVMDGPTPGIGFDYSYVPATKEVMTTLAEVNRVLTGTEPVERDATHNLPSKDDTH